MTVLSDCIDLADVRVEVQKNYTENLWWPLAVRDSRLRMLIAGWSTRVSYAHIQHYRAVVARLDKMTWEGLAGCSDDEVRGVVAPLGLQEARLAYFRSLDTFLRGRHIEGYLSRSNADLIYEFAQCVNGAGYKVAQCAVLYAKGYHCGIVPVDSGMVSMLAPLFPTKLPSGALAHELLRRWLEQLISEADVEIRQIAAGAGFVLDDAVPPTWWVHLVLIYYKRLYWNRRRSIGPFRREPQPWVPACQDADTDLPGGTRVIVEGADGAGKTTLAHALERKGATLSHSAYEPGDDLTPRYLTRLGKLDGSAVFDRSFISEFVYGTARRGASRLSLPECDALMDAFADAGFVLIYLDEDESILRQRRSDTEGIADIIVGYRRFFEQSRSSLPIFRTVPSKLAPGYLVNLFAAARPHAASKAVGSMR